MIKNLFAWASIDENGNTHGGKKGDQTGKEVKIGNYYNFGQTYVCRILSPHKRKKVAEIAKAIALNDFTGYNQYARHHLYDCAKSYKWNWNAMKKDMDSGKIKFVDCDCSSFAATVINLAWGKNKVPCTTTGNFERDVIKLHPLSFKKISVKQAEKKFKKGDMPVKPYGHIIINI